VPNPTAQSEPPGSAPIGRSGSVLVWRLAVLLIVAAVTIAAFFLRKSDGQGAASRAGYVCPMHPAVRSKLPGACPICGMALEPWRAMSSERPPAAPDSGGPRILDYEIVTVRPRAMARETRAPAWVESPGLVVALLYDDEIATVSAAATLSFVPAATPGRSLPVRRAGRPPQTWDEATSRVELRLAGDASAAHVGDVGWLKLPPDAPPPLVVPDPAIVHALEGPFVLVAGADNRTFTRRPVRVGRGFFGASAIVAGLNAGERVVVSNAFFLDVEERLRAQPPESRRSGP